MEVTWPDGKMASRNVAGGEMNSVLEIPYPRDEDRLQDPAPLEVRRASGPQSPSTDPRAEAGFPGICRLRLYNDGSLTKGRLHSNPTICRVCSTTHTSLLLLSESPGYWQGLCAHSTEEES